MPQSHETGNGERSGGWFGQEANDRLQLFQAVGVGFFRLGGLRVNCRVAGRILPLEIVLLLRQCEDSADDALNMFEGIPAQVGFCDLTQPALDMVGSGVFLAIPCLRAA